MDKEWLQENVLKGKHLGVEILLTHESIQKYVIDNDLYRNIINK